MTTSTTETPERRWWRIWHTHWQPRCDDDAAVPDYSPYSAMTRRVLATRVRATQEEGDPCQLKN